jgi:hypothetical protein
MSDTNTNIEQMDIDQADLDNLLGMPGADSVITPVAESSKSAEEAPNFFSSEKVDMEFMNPDSTESSTEDTTEDTTEEFNSIVNEVTETEDSNLGRPKLDKNGMVQLTNRLIEEGLIKPFEGEDLENFTEKDFIELFQVNLQEREKKVAESVPGEFFNSLPRELQYATEYVAQGGTDLKGLFRTLAASEEVKSLDPETERGQEMIIKKYLQSTNFGTPEEIDEEIDTWKDLGKLEEKALKFKPKLDAIQEKSIKQQIAKQEAMKRQQEEASYAYMESVYSTLETGDLNGIKLPSKVQNMLYAGLVQPNYPSISGKNTNLFGHLIEKYQFVEPNHGLIAEALWLLADPQGYKAAQAGNVKNEAAQEMYRKLKTEEQHSKSSSSNTEPETKTGTRSASIARPSKDFFKR